MSDGYNGWTNYETWCVNLWWNNDSGSQDALAEMARGCWERAEPSELVSRSEVARQSLAEAIQEMVAENMPEMEASLYSDILKTALCDVNYREIANAALEALDLDGYESRSFLPA